MMAKMTLAENKADRPINVLDPAVGIGRMLNAASKYAPDGSVFYGTDIDNRAIRTSFANACVHKIPMRLLCANSLSHATDPRTQAGRHNWKYCNHWQRHYGELKSTREEYEELKQKEAVPKKMKLEQYKHRKAEQLSLFDYGAK